MPHTVVQFPPLQCSVIPRPHTAASTSKAAGNAIALADALIKHNHDVIKALKAWEPAQLAYGNQLLVHG